MAGLPDQIIQAVAALEKAHADNLAALSPAERDFALRRMPVETLAESYRAANVTPPDLGAPLRQFVDRRAIRDAVIELRLLAKCMRRAGHESYAAEMFRLSNEIREALK